MTGLIRAVIVTAVLTCSLTVNIGMYTMYVHPQEAYKADLITKLESLPLTKPKKATGTKGKPNETN